MDMNIWLSIGSFFAILIVLVLIHAKVNGGFKIEMSWVALALTPAIIWLLVNGSLAEFSGFGIAFKIKEASAQTFSLSLEGDKIEFSTIEQEEKGGTDRIDRMIEQRTPALAFVLGRKGYYNQHAIEDYLRRLTQHEFFKYGVFIDASGKFQGMTDARKLLRQLDNLGLVKVIEERALDAIPGVAIQSVSATGSKRQALQIMHDHNLNELPVVDEDARLVGVVERNKLTSSILMQLVSDL
jgi:CBS domain-containing protein